MCVYIYIHTHTHIHAYSFLDSFPLWFIVYTHTHTHTHIHTHTYSFLDSFPLWFIRILNGEGNGTPLQYSCLENPMDGGAWRAAVHGVTRSQTRPSDFTFTFPFHALEKEMATHSSILAWRIPGMGQPGGLPCMGLHRVGTRLKRLSSSSSSRILNIVPCAIWSELVAYPS